MKDPNQNENFQLMGGQQVNCKNAQMKPLTVKYSMTKADPAELKKKKAKRHQTTCHDYVAKDPTIEGVDIKNMEFQNSALTIKVPENEVSSMEDLIDLRDELMKGGVRYV